MTNPVLLAVDDDPVNLDIISSIFEGMPYELMVSGSGERAMEVLMSEAAVDAVILDRMMPGMDGMQFIQRMKAQQHLARTPVVMQTAAAAPHQIEEGLRAGVYYYLTKPYTPDALRTIVAAALEDVRRRGELQGQLLSGSRALMTLDKASFTLRTLEDVRSIADLMSQACPDPPAAWTGLFELLCNAVEHGNLGLTCEAKRELKRNGGWEQEVVRRLELPQYRERCARVSFERLPGALRFVIADEGDGFTWKPFLDFDPGRAFDPNGRGIALARAMCFSDLHYEGVGNIAVATIPLPS